MHSCLERCTAGPRYGPSGAARVPPSERGIKARIEEIDRLLKVERSPFIQELRGKERRKLQSLEAKASLPEYVEPVLELVEKAQARP